jgi:hypothetical protein
MSSSTEAHPNSINSDPHFNRLVGLSGLSQAALKSVIEALQAKEQTNPDTPPDSIDANPEKLLSHYIQNPELPHENHIT